MSLCLDIRYCYAKPLAKMLCDYDTLETLIHHQQNVHQHHTKIIVVSRDCNIFFLCRQG